MSLTHIVFKDLAQLQDHIKSGHRTLFHSSRTSTVIPYESLKENGLDLGQEELFLGDLSNLPKKIELNEKGNLVVSSSVCWKEAREFLKNKDLEIMAAPTEELACICAGVATSATGERTFGFGTLREQVVSLKFMDFEGNVSVLKRENLLLNHKIGESTADSKVLSAYQKEFQPYYNFKNAPFPRMEHETDLMIGTEGQLGVILEVELQLAKGQKVTFMMIQLPRWEEDYGPHLEILEKVQNFRGKVLSCELLDWNSLEHLKEDERPADKKDLIFFEVLSEEFEGLYENFFSQFKLIGPDDIFEISASKFHHIRVSVPRSIYELNAKMKVSKKGTDTQVSPGNFRELLDIYRDWSKLGIRYNLFGHFGDHHLHFNFMPSRDEEKGCNEVFEAFYEKVKEMGGSPFAEHGIGLLKQKFIKIFLKGIHLEMYAVLKSNLDPHGIFFPKGYMSMSRKND